MPDSPLRSARNVQKTNGLQGINRIIKRVIFPILQQEAGRSLPAALVTLAVGALLLTPFLSFVSSRSLGLRALNQTFNEQYAADAGIEFGIWTVLNDPTFRTQTDLNPATPQPVTFPETINGIPSTDINVNVTAIPIGQWTTNPPASVPGSISQGGDMAFAGGGVIYVLQGGNSKNFRRYNTSTHTWTSLQNTDDNVKQGGGMAYDGGNYIFAFFNTQGQGNSTDFWRYNIANDNWKKMEPTPTKIGNDTALASQGGTIYVISGKQKQFWSYESSNWNNLEDVPGNVGAGTSLVAVGGNSLYAFRGNKRDFWRYDISSDTWTTLGQAPDKVSKGGDLAYHSGNYIYATQGSSTAFWRYNISTDSWAVLSNALASFGDGSALAFTDANGGYATQGGGSSTFWRFDVTPPQYDIQSTANDVTTTARIEIDGTDKTILFWDIE